MPDTEVKTTEEKLVSLLISFVGLDWFTGAKISPIGALSIGYFHQKTNSPLQLEVELEPSLASKETSATFSYQYDLGKANTTFRGKSDS